MDAQEFSAFENSEWLVEFKMKVSDLNKVRLLLNDYVSCDQDLYPNNQFQALILLAGNLQSMFEQNEGLNKYIERELAEKHGRDFTG